MTVWRPAKHWEGCFYTDVGGRRFMVIANQGKFKLLRDGGHAGWYPTEALARAGVALELRAPRQSLRSLSEKISLAPAVLEAAP